MSELDREPLLSSEEMNELDELLEALRDETPEMPADFHEGWIGALRAEIAEQSEAAPGSKAHKAVPLRGNGAARRQWRYVLSAAAVFVFLIGGTLLTRDFLRPAASTMEEAPAAAKVMMAAEPTAMLTAEPAQLFAAGTVTAESASETVEEAAELEEAWEEDADAGNGAWPLGAAMDMETAESADTAMDQAADEAMMMEEDAPEEAAIITAEGAEREPEGLAGFLADMGRFLGFVWPYLVGLAALWGLVMGIQKTRRKQKTKKQED